MKWGSCVVKVGMIVAFAAVAVSSARAQHLHPHGDHFDVHRNVPHGHDRAGHLIDRHGHHIDGHGNHTGSIGVYENGSYSLPYSSRWNSSYRSYSGYPYSGSLYPGSLYSGSLYSGSVYSGSLYSGAPYGSLYSNSVYGAPLYSSPLYSAPRVLPRAPALGAAPLAAGNAVRNRIPLPGPAPAGQGGGFVLTNPRTSGGPIRYSLNSFVYTIKPGESQSVPLDRDWVITFDNGLNQTVTYRLEDGVYEFTVSTDDGWNLVKLPPQAPALGDAAGANAVLAPPMNAAPGQPSVRRGL